MASDQPCPFESQLRQLLDGTLPEDGEQSLAAHLRECSTCRKTLDDLAPDDLLPEEEKSKLAAAKKAPDEALGRIIDDLRGNPPKATEPTMEMPVETDVASRSSSSELSLSFLSASDNPQALGKLADYDIIGVTAP